MTRLYIHSSTLVLYTVCYQEESIVEDINYEEEITITEEPIALNSDSQHVNCDWFFLDGNSEQEEIIIEELPFAEDIETNENKLLSKGPIA